MKKSLIPVLGIVLFSAACSGPKSENKTVQVDSTAQVHPLVAIGDHQFLSVIGKDTTEVKLRFLSTDDIRGEMRVLPYQKDGSIGTLTGKLNAQEELELTYDYTIEGNRQSEPKIMKIEGDKLFQKNLELEDPTNTGKMQIKVGSTAKFDTTFVLNRVNK
jgi:hypothetical protein